MGLGSAKMGVPEGMPVGGCWEVVLVGALVGGFFVGAFFVDLAGALVGLGLDFSGALVGVFFVGLAGGLRLVAMGCCSSEKDARGRIANVERVTKWSGDVE